MAGALALWADSVARPFPYVATNDFGTVYFRMNPDRSEPWNQSKGSGVAYRVSARKDEVLWRTKGWYSYQVFLDAGGRYLAAMGPWNVGSEPKKSDLAVAFYCDGKLLKSYSPAELVEDRSKLLVTVSHYMWLAREVGDGDEQAELSVIDGELFRLKTCDGIVYWFDMATGEIRRKERRAVRRAEPGPDVGLRRDLRTPVSLVGA